jgi:PAS domain S-box-containing protein
MAYPSIPRWMAQPAKYGVLRYGLAVASVMVALLLEVLFLHFNLPHPFAAFALCAIAISFWYGGIKPGIVAVLLSALIRGFLFEPGTTTLSRVLYDLVFVVFAVLMSWLRRRRSALEDEVAQRTAELTVANEELEVEIAEHNRADEELRRSEAFLFEAQRLSRAGSWRHDVSSGAITVSPELLRIYDVKPYEDRSTAEFFFNRLHPEDRPVVEQSYDRAQREKAEFNQHHRIVLPDGSIRHVHNIGHPVFNESGDTVEFVGTAMDVTDQRRARAELEKALGESKLAQEELQRQKEYLDGLFELSPDAVILTDENFVMLRVNKEFVRMFGYTPEEAVGRWLPDLIVPEELRAAAVGNRVRVASGEKVYLESVRQRKDGVRFDTSVVASRISLGRDQVAVYLIYRDISERKRAEEKLRRSEGYLADAQKLTHTGSWAWNVRTGALFWSQEIFRIYDYDPQEIGPTWPQFLERVHPEDRPRIEQRAEMEATEKEWVDSEGDFRIVLPDGTTKHLHSVAHPVMDESGEIFEVVGTVMDVTEQRKARAELEKAFEEINRLKDQLHDENLALREQIDQAFMFEEIVGSSPALQLVLSRIVKVAPTDSTVLITGETGTGKELIARAIHKRSQRSTQAFISVNCASIPPSLIASELFGHEKGAFTGALQLRQGRFELAHSGTIFLDEIGELPAETQIALLRVVQERQFERVGGNRVLSTNVRVITATNRDLTAAISAGAFRADLFYRLNVFPIEVPPLRQRKEDIPMLVEYFVKRYAEKLGKQINRIDKGTLELCQSYHWPGNIRELQNIIERSVILCSGNTFWVDEAWLSSQEPTRPELSGPLTEALQSQEKEMIEAALAESKGKVAGPNGAATRLGIPRSTLDWKIKQLNIKKHKFAADS